MHVRTYDSCDSIMLYYYKYRTPIDRDYKKVTEQDCIQVVTHYRGKKFDHPCDVGIGPNREVVIADHNNRCIVVLDDRLNLLKVIRERSRLVSPVSIAVTDNIIAVSNYCSDQVKKYSLQGGELLSVIGCYGNKTGQFNRPMGLAFNNNKLLYVVDRDNFRIQVFRQDDTLAFSFGNRGNNPGQFQCPTRIAIDPNNNVLVTDYRANCIHIFSPSGKFMQTVRCRRPCAVAISHTGYLVTGHDGDYNKIRVWSPTYQLINQFGKKGSKQGEFCYIEGMAVDSNGSIYVVETDNERLQVISNHSSY